MVRTVSHSLFIAAQVERVVVMGREDGEDVREAGGAADAGEEGGDEDGVEGVVEGAAELHFMVRQCGPSW
jgi:hypothetical protein